MENWTDSHFVAGACSLDFCNTLSGRSNGRFNDRLTDTRTIISWARAARLPVSKRMRQSQLNGGVHTVEDAKDLRETIYQIFNRTRLGRHPTSVHLLYLSNFVEKTAAWRELVRHNGVFSFAWRKDADDLTRTLGEVALDATSLLTSGRWHQVKKCKSETCGWLFVDDSKNRSRAWCDMAVCGNRAKIRRHRSS